MKRLSYVIIIVLLLSLNVPILWAGQETYETNEWVGHSDVKGSKDMAAISRFQGSLIQYYKVLKWDKYTLPVSKIVAADGAKTWEKKLALQGTITRIQYSVNRDNNPALIAQNYLTALTGAGWKILFQGCGDDELGNDSSEWCYYYYDLNNEGSTFGPRGRDHCYLAASYDDALHTYYAAIYMVDFETESKGLAFSLITQDVIEVKKAQTGLITAQKMTDGLSNKGHVAVYGLYFDTGKAGIKASSSVALEQIAALLKQKPGLNLYVVGNTDDSGNFAANMSLSTARANAVVTRLIQDYHISSARLQASGVGPLAPVASNDTDEGRALNRRVELVKTNHHVVAASSRGPVTKPTRSKLMNLPDFEIKQEAVQGAHGQTSEAQTVTPPSRPVEAVPQQKPQKLIPVPSVIGKFKISAEKALKQGGFKVVVRGKKIGKVSAQSPDADTRVAPGTQVTITIGK